MNNCQASIIIPTRDKLSRLLLVLRALEGQIAAAEVIVIFDGCRPETVSEFNKRRFSLGLTTIIMPENIGRAAARNRGIEAAHGEIVIFLDDDRIPGPDFIAGHIRGHRDKCVLLGERRAVTLSEAAIEDLSYADGASLYARIEPESFIDCDTSSNGRRRFLFHLRSGLRWMRFFTGNASVEREDLMEIGGFDEDFKGWGYEDRDLGYRLANKGLCFTEDSKIINYHLVHRRDPIAKHQESIGNIRYMLQKCKGDPAAASVLRAALAMEYLERLIRR